MDAPARPPRVAAAIWEVVTPLPVHKPVLIGVAVREGEGGASTVVVPCAEIPTPPIMPVLAIVMTLLLVRVQEEIGAVILIPVERVQTDGARVIRVPHAQRDPISIIVILNRCVRKIQGIGALARE